MNKGNSSSFAKNTSFWKESKRSKVLPSNFFDANEDNAVPITRKTRSNSQNAIQKAGMLKQEGIFQAESGNLDEALTRWSEAISLNPHDETLYEMQSQVLMMQEKDFQAVQQAEKSCQLKKNWGTGWQTLGRAQMNLGHLELAVKNFSRAFHLNPWDENLRNNDLVMAAERWNRQQRP